MNQITTPSRSQAELSQLVGQIHCCSIIETEQIFTLYQQYIRQKLSANAVTWIAVYRGNYGREYWKTELLFNWKVMDTVFVIDDTPECVVSIQAHYLQLAQKYGLDPLAELAIKQAGKTRVFRNTHALSQREWSEHWIKKEFLDIYGIEDRIVGVFNVDSQAESYLLIDRPAGSEPYSQGDEEILYQILQEFPRLHYILLLERGLTKQAKRPLSPRQRELVRLMLSPLPEKEIARQMKLSQGTVHNYIKDLYLNFNVKSRLELIQLWLNPTRLVMVG